MEVKNPSQCVALYRNIYRGGGDCLDIEDPEWVVWVV